MTRIQCMIVDDEPLARTALAHLLKKIEDCTLVAQCASALEARSALAANPIDLLFLDIAMPQLSGLELAELLTPRPAIIFTTAHREYAVEGFELQALDYLLKPVSLARLVQAVDRYRASLAGTPGATDTTGMASPAPAAPRLTARVDRQNVHIRIPDITYVEGLRDYVRIHTADDMLVTKMTLTEVEQTLAPHGFLRIHKSFLIRISAVEAHSAEMVLTAGKRLPIGRAWREHALKALAGA